VSRSGPKSAAETPGWLVGVVIPVAVAAAAATAHGLFEVVVAASVPAVVAGLYPVITDGLAVVAYAATTRLTGKERGYAWAVVVLAAALSGIAQAVYLADGIADAPAVAAGHGLPGVLRFGVGAWPAVAAALVAHLLFMLSAAARSNPASSRPDADPSNPSAAPGVQAAPAVQRPGVQPSSPAAPVDEPVVRPAVQPRPRPALPAGRAGERREVSNPSSPAMDRARAEARSRFTDAGSWPTVTELQEATGVSRGTAGAALKELRDQPAPLRIVHDDLGEASANQ
jgi:hypothetical protein